MRVLDLCAGELGWSKIFAARGHQCVCVDLKHPKILPPGCRFIQTDILMLYEDYGIVIPCSGSQTEERFIFDFIVASTPCEEFSVHCMKFTAKKEHPYPEMGIKLFHHTRRLCEYSGLPFIMENVRCAEQFVGNAVAHAGSFYLWGNAVPPLLPKGLIKMGNQGGWRRGDGTFRERSKGARIPGARSATIPSELANCVAAYAERILEAKCQDQKITPETMNR